MSDPTPPLRPGQQGFCVDDGDPAAFRAAVHAALDYRGDVTLIRRGEGEPLVGFIFDWAEADGPDGGVVRLLPASGAGEVAVPLAGLARIEFSGRDTAEGKSFETWIRHYVEKKLAGETASIESEPLEEEGAQGCGDGGVKV